jgi:hypothetical protein
MGGGVVGEERATQASHLRQVWISRGGFNPLDHSLLQEARHDTESA